MTVELSLIPGMKFRRTSISNIGALHFQHPGFSKKHNGGVSHRPEQNGDTSIFLA